MIVQDELRRLGRALRSACGELELEISNVHHSPISRSIYYHVWGTTGDAEVRLSDHELPHPSLRQFEIIISENPAENNEALTDMVECDLSEMV